MAGVLVRRPQSRPLPRLLWRNIAQIGRAVSAHSPSTPKQPSHSGEPGKELPVPACQRWALNSGLLRGCPHCCHFGGQPGCDTESPSSLPLPHECILWPPSPSHPSKKGHSPSSRSWRTPTSLSWPSPCLCEGKTPKGGLGLNLWWWGHCGSTLICSQLWERRPQLCP